MLSSSPDDIHDHKPSRGGAVCAYKSQCLIYCIVVVAVAINHCK